jgi:hypothetical protein
MGIFGDAVGSVVLKYKADIDDAKIKLRELTGEQKKQAAAAVQSVEDQVKAHERLASRIAVGMAAIGGAIAIAIGSWRSYAEHSRLAAATSTVDMSKLRDASRGLMTDLELMQVAAVSANGKWKLTSDEMANVLGAARALELKGIMPLTEAATKLGDAVKKGEVDPLKELGIVYDEQLAKYDKRAAAMKALAELAAQSARTSETEAEAMRRHATSAENYYNRAKNAVGQFTHETVAGFVIAADDLGKAWNSLGDAFSSDMTTRQLMELARIKMGLDETVNIAKAVIAEIAEADAELTKLRNENQRRREEDEAYADYLREYRYKKQKEEAQDHLDRHNREGKYAPKKGGPGRDFELSFAEATQTTGFMSTAGLAGAFGRLGRYAVGEEFGTGPLGGIVGAAANELSIFGDDFGGRYAEASAIKDILPKDLPDQSLLERMLGPKTEIDGYRDAWTGLTDTVLAGYDAMVTGSESVGEAMKKALGGAIHATGRKMFVRGLEETAEGVAALIFNPAAAGQHFAAAGLFLAGSGVAAAAANALGAGGGAASGAGAGAGASASGVGLGGVGFGSTGSTTRNYYIGDSFGSETPRSQAARFRLIQKEADRYRREADGTQFS